MRNQPTKFGGRARKRARSSTEIAVRRTNEVVSTGNKSGPSAYQRELTSQERKALQSVEARRAAANPMPRIKLVDGQLAPEHPDEAVGLTLLTQALGTYDPEFAFGILKQFVPIAMEPNGQQVNERELNFLFSSVNGTRPRDTTEAMLATQMAAVHKNAMMMAARLAASTNTSEQETTTRMFNNLVRTFATLVDAFVRHRNGGNNVAVQHVSVSEGGQAIVSNVGPAAGEKTYDRARLHPVSPRTQQCLQKSSSQTGGSQGNERR